MTCSRCNGHMYEERSIIAGNVAKDFACLLCGNRDSDEIRKNRAEAISVSNVEEKEGGRREDAEPTNGDQGTYKMTHLDLFSGIGGFALAAHWQGYETVVFVEIDQFCQKVLRKNFPGVPIYDDIKKIQWFVAGTESGKAIPSEPIGLHPESRIQVRTPRIDLLTGGFPCQPFSCAGKRAGTEDDRFIWPEMLRAIHEIKPRWVLAENVPGLLTLQDGMVFEGVCTDLEAEGYEVLPLVIPACSQGAPHRRDRVWIVGHSRQQRKGRTGEGFGIEQFNSEAKGKWSASGDRPSDPDWQEHWYEVATRLCRMDARISNRLDRLKSLGNAILPQVAHEIMMAIKEVDKDGRTNEISRT